MQSKRFFLWFYVVSSKLFLFLLYYGGFEINHGTAKKIIINANNNLSTISNYRSIERLSLSSFYLFLVLSVVRFWNQPHCCHDISYHPDYSYEYIFRYSRRPFVLCYYNYVVLFYMRLFHFCSVCVNATKFLGEWKYQRLPSVCLFDIASRWMRWMTQVAVAWTIRLRLLLCRRVRRRPHSYRANIFSAQWNFMVVFVCPSAEVQSGRTFHRRISVQTQDLQLTSVADRKRSTRGDRRA